VRVAHVVPRGEQPSSGLFTVIVHLAAALSRQGHDVEVWQLHRWDGEAYDEARRRLAAAGVAQVAVAGRRIGAAAAAAGEARAVDVVHLHGAFNTSNTAVSLALRRPYVFSPHSGYAPASLGRSRGRKLIYRAAFERRTLRRASLVVALTDAERRDVRRAGATGTVVVIPNGVEPAPDLDGGPFRRDLGLDRQTPLVVFVGRLDVHRKGLDRLVQGLASAPGWHLALVGPEFRDVDLLRRQVRDLEMQDRVHLAGERHGRALREAVAAADVFALLSRWEGLPMALLEALSASKPALVSPEVEEVIGVAAAGGGWVVDDASVGPVLGRLGGPGRPELVKAGRAAGRFAKRYDWGDVARRYSDAYELAIATAGERRS
jgi:glycosyltransferase involved in cell wall biosynthesis